MMGSILSTLGFLALAALLIPMWLAPVAELSALVRRAVNRRLPERARLPSGDGFLRLLFLVPAHDEEAMIERCVRSLVEQDYPRETLDVVVIADNCSDSTPQLARSAGARCLERDDPDDPGKPQAIAWALTRLRIRDWDVCIIVDADTITDRAFAGEVNKTAGREPRDTVMQAYNGIMNERETQLTRLAGLYIRIRYESQYPLKRAVGLNCPLAGNGMCFGTNVLAERGWTAFSIGEDLELYAQYTIWGVEIEYAREARVYAAEASSLGRGATQRRRWMAGRLWVARRYAGRILRTQEVDMLQKLDLLGELVTPSPVLHGTLAVGIATLALLTRSPFSWWIAALSLGSLMPLCVHTLNALVRHPEPVKALSSFLYLVPYALWRSVNALLTVASVRDQTWRREARDAGVDIDGALSNGDSADKRGVGH